MPGLLPQTRRDKYDNAKTRRRGFLKKLALWSYRLPSVPCGPGTTILILICTCLLYLFVSQLGAPAHAAQVNLSPPASSKQDVFPEIQTDRGLPGEEKGMEVSSLNEEGDESDQLEGQLSTVPPGFGHDSLGTEKQGSGVLDLRANKHEVEVRRADAGKQMDPEKAALEEVVSDLHGGRGEGKEGKVKRTRKSWGVFDSEGQGGLRGKEASGKGEHAGELLMEVGGTKSGADVLGSGNADADVTDSDTVRGVEVLSNATRPPKAGGEGLQTAGKQSLTKSHPQVTRDLDKDSRDDVVAQYREKENKKEESSRHDVAASGKIDMKDNGSEAMEKEVEPLKHLTKDGNEEVDEEEVEEDEEHPAGIKRTAGVEGEGRGGGNGTHIVSSNGNVANESEASLQQLSRRGTEALTEEKKDAGKTEQEGVTDKAKDAHLKLKGDQQQPEGVKAEVVSVTGDEKTKIDPGRGKETNGGLENGTRKNWGVKGINVDWDDGRKKSGSVGRLDYREGTEGAQKLPEHVWKQRQVAVRDAFLHAWGGYVKFAFGSDELLPETKGSVDSLGGLGATIVDALDTAIIMDLPEVVQVAGGWIEKELEGRMQAERQVNVFETTIRVLGGLLSAHHLLLNTSWRGVAAGRAFQVSSSVKWGPSPQTYLELAHQLGDILMEAFKASQTPIPYPDVVLGSRRARMESPVGECSTSEATTLGIEFSTLSNLTGNPRYGVATLRTLYHVGKLPSYDGLVPIYISARTGHFVSGNIRLGSRGDSYYEYLLKVWLLLGKGPSPLKRMYDRALGGIRHHLIKRSQPVGLSYVAELPHGQHGETSPKMDHLVCFLGGTIALGATGGLTVQQMKERKLLTWQIKEDLQLAHNLTHTCLQMYAVTATGLAPEITYFNTKAKLDGSEVGGTRSDAKYGRDIEIQYGDRHNLLRPETVESLFYMHRITGHPIYRQWGWAIFQAFEKYAKVGSGGYSSLGDVTTVPPPLRNKMETFFLGETLKYLYLLFGPDDVLPLTEYVFNTEAHPVPILSPMDGRDGIPKDELPSLHVPEEEIEGVMTL